VSGSSASAASTLTTLLTNFVNAVNTNSEIMMTNSEITKENSEIMNTSSEIIEIMNTNSEIMKRVLIRLERDTPGQSIDFMQQGNFKRIHLKRYLGEGTSSRVYEIDWENISSAIKVFKSGYYSQSEVRALKFLNEQHFQNVPIHVAHDDNSIIIRPVCEQIGNQFQVSHAQQLLPSKTHS
jgi:hypothetical protein